MEFIDRIKKFYMDHLPAARLEKNFIKAPCPLCEPTEETKAGVMVVYINPESLFAGYFICLNRCRPGGFPLYFSQLMGIDAAKVPGHDPDREPYVRAISAIR